MKLNGSPANSKSRSPQRANQTTTGVGNLGGMFALGIDRNTITEEEINNFLKLTSENSLKEIARITEMKAGESSKGGRMIRGDEKITLQEIEEFMSQISLAKIPKIHRKDLMKYLNSFPQKHTAGKNAAAEAKSIRG
jgi:7-keto-8-aminopelargonate synthetase-like enzyme